MQFIETYWGLWLFSALAFLALAFANQASRVRRVMQHGGPDSITNGMIWLGVFTAGVWGSVILLGISVLLNIIHYVK